MNCERTLQEAARRCARLHAIDCTQADRDDTAQWQVESPEHRRAYAALGFVPTPLALHFMGKPLAGELSPDPRAWRFTLGDTDFF